MRSCASVRRCRSEASDPRSIRAGADSAVSDMAGQSAELVGLGEIKIFQIGFCVSDRWIRRRRLRPLEHLLRYVETQNSFGSLRTCPTTKPAITAAKIHHVQLTHVRKQSHQRRPFRRACQAIH